MAKNIGFNKKTGSQKIKFSFSASDCKNCPYFKKCIGEKVNPYRRICNTISLPIYYEQKNFQETDYFKERYRHSPIIEGKNADLKQNYGLKRTHNIGFFATVFTANARKTIRLVTGI